MVDDSCERYAESIVSECDIRYLPKDEHEGQIAAWESGLEVSEGRYVQLHDDDRLEPEKIDRQVRVFEAEDGVGVAFANIREEDGSVSVPE